MMSDIRGTNEYYGDEDDVEMTEAEEQQSEEEAHQHFVIQEFSDLLLSVGSHSVIGQLSDEAREELIMAFQENFNNLKKESK